MRVFVVTEIIIWFISIYFDVFAYQNLANLIAVKIWSLSALLKSCLVLIFRYGIPRFFLERGSYFLVQVSIVNKYLGISC